MTILARNGLVVPPLVTLLEQAVLRREEPVAIPLLAKEQSKPVFVLEEVIVFVVSLVLIPVIVAILVPRMVVINVLVIMIIEIPNILGLL